MDRLGNDDIVMKIIMVFWGQRIESEHAVQE